MWYIRCAIRATMALATTPSEPPEHDILDFVDNFILSVLYSDATLRWVDTQAHTPGEAAIDVWLAGPHSAGRNPTLHDADRKRSEDITSERVSLTDLPTGTFTAFWRIINAEGLATPFQSIRFEVA